MLMLIAHITGTMIRIPGLGVTVARARLMCDHGAGASQSTDRAFSKMFLLYIL